MKRGQYLSKSCLPMTSKSVFSGVFSRSGRIKDYVSMVSPLAAAMEGSTLTE
jgi:hypothetical protein